jgi:flagellar biosynthesis/type III secretory pathway M-ring protein FliF/YscJ
VQYVLVLIVLAVVVYTVSAPLRAQRSAAAVGPDPVAELEAARDAKYREIRDAELDVRTGKLSDEDYESLDTTLRTEAIEILNKLDQAREGEELPSAP